MPNNLRFDEYRDMKWITIVFLIKYFIDFIFILLSIPIIIG